MQDIQFLIKHFAHRHDNASPHLGAESAFERAMRAAGCRGTLRFQPPSSPDLNVLDLAVFNAVQARQRKTVTRSLRELIDAVSAAYWGLPPSTLNAAFLTLQCVMNACIEDGGGNHFPLTHMLKAQLGGRDNYLLASVAPIVQSSLCSISRFLYS